MGKVNNHIELRHKILALDISKGSRFRREVESTPPYMSFIVDGPLLLLKTLSIAQN